MTTLLYNELGYWVSVLHVGSVGKFLVHRRAAYYNNVRRLHETMPLLSRREITVRTGTVRTQHTVTQ